MSKTKVRIAIGIVAALFALFQRFTQDKSAGDMTSAKEALPRETVSSQSDGKNSEKRIESSRASARDSRPSAHRTLAKWSETSPAINLQHIFHGAVNRDGKAVGFHARSHGVDPQDARVVRIKDPPNRHGVYTAAVEVRGASRWLSKFSTFFPDSMSKEQIQQAILNAYTKSSNSSRQPWDGPSGLGFEIQGYTLSRGDINTAYPVYRKDRN